MATAAVDEDEEVLTCTGCLKRYTDPRTLDCKHTFCRRCLTDHVKNHVDAVKTKTIPCPSCPQVTRVPDPSRPVDEWAGQLQPGHVVQELMARGNKEAPMEETLCNQCHQLGETTSGMFWCAECEVVFCQKCGRGHNLLPSCSDHDLCDLKDQGQVSRRKSRCSEHKDQLVEFYCKICNESHCRLCFDDHHREHVVTIKSCVSNMKSELSEVNFQLKEQEKMFNNFVEDQKTTLTGLNTGKLSVIGEIRCASQEAIDKIKQKEKQLIDQVEEMTNRETNERKAKVKLENIQMQTYRQYSEYIKQAVNSDSEVEVCDVYQAWKSGQLEVSQGGDKGMGAGNVLSVLFSKVTPKDYGFFHFLHLGDIEAVYPPKVLLSSPVFSDPVDTRVDKDKYDTYIYDVTVLEVGGVHTIVVTDFSNHCIKSFYTRNNTTCHSRLQLNSSPGRISHLGDDKVMVTLQFLKQIVTVSVTPDLVLMSHINTSKEYTSLAVMSPTRLAAGGYNIGVDFLNMQGEVIKSVITHTNYQSNPIGMCVNNTGHLLVSDVWKKTVTCLTPEGEVAWKYSGTGRGKFEGPTGITTTSKGDILVADGTRVIQLTESGDFVTVVFSRRDPARSLRHVCVDKRGTLFIYDHGKVLRYIFL